MERFELRKTGDIAFNHPQGTHDDVFWATALTVYAAAKSPRELTVSNGEKPWRKRKFPSAKRKGKDAYKLQRQLSQAGSFKN